MICPNCFKEISTHHCPHCKYVYDESLRDDEALEPGTKLNLTYTVGRVLGRGGFGITYLAYDQIRDQICCLKEYFPNDISRRGQDNCLIVDSDKQHLFEQGKNSFIKEATVLLRKIVGCRNIVKVTNFFSDNNTAYIAMEYLDGMNVKRFMAKYYPSGRMDLKNALQILMTVSEALVEVHSKGVLHRDITPENIFISLKDGSITLIDFGSSREFLRQNMTGMSVYIKPGYAPPEQYHYDGNQGPWSDIYSLAATFYYMVSGIAVTPSKDRIISDDLKPLYVVNQQVSKELSYVIERALCLDYSKRYQTAEEFIYALNSAVGEPPKKKNAYIKIVSGSPQDGKPSKIMLDPGKYYTVGRNPDKNSLSVKNDNVTRESHCIIKYVNEMFEVIDKSSTGTYESSKSRLVTGMPYLYNDGTQLYLGNLFSTQIELIIE